MTSRRGPRPRTPAALISHRSPPHTLPKREVPAASRIKTFEAVARECAQQTRPRREELAYAVRTLAQTARRADIDSDAAAAAVSVAFLSDRPQRGESLRKGQIEIITSWFRSGWADG